jgi:hypothetical protein
MVKSWLRILVDMAANLLRNNFVLELKQLNIYKNINYLKLMLKLSKTISEESDNGWFD